MEARTLVLFEMGELMINTVEGAEKLATQLLAKTPQRLAHVKGVVAHMAKWLDFAGETGDVYDLHMQIAWLHDIGYSDLLNRVDFHAVDGFSYLMGQGWSYPVCLGVLVHSFSAELAAYMKPQLKELYERAEHQAHVQHDPNIFKYITLVDLHTSPRGDFVSFDTRRMDIYSRYGDSPITWHIYEVSNPLKFLAYELDFKAFAREMAN